MRFAGKKEHIIIVIALVMLNFIIKGLFLSNNSLAGDEAFSVFHAQMSLASIINLLAEGNNPPLYEVILHFWIKLFGISEFSVRFPSLIFSSISVIYIYKLGAKFLNKRIGLFASVIFIFSNYHVFYAHEARVYALLGMLSVMSMYYFSEILKICMTSLVEEDKTPISKGLKWKVAILLVLNALIVYAHYFGFFILITQFLFLSFYKELFLRFWKQIVLAVVILTLLYIPNIGVLINRFMESSVNGTWLKPPNGIDTIYNSLRQFSNAPIVAALLIVIFIAALVKFIIRRKNETVGIYNRLVIFWFLFIFFFMFGISYAVPMFLDRYLMPGAIAFSLMLGVSVDYHVRKPLLNYTLLCVVCVLFIATAKPNNTNERYVKQTVEKLKEIKNENTLVLICPQHFVLNFAYYYNIEIFKEHNGNTTYSAMNNALNKENIYGINNISEIDYENQEHIVFIDAAANFSYPDNNIKNKLSEKYNLANEYQFFAIFTVYEFEFRTSAFLNQ